MKAENYRAMNAGELHAELERLRRHLFELRSQAVTEKLENPMHLKHTRRDIARVLTVLRQKGEVNVEQRQAHLTAQAARR